jgi:hypothetical protein
MSKTTAGRSSRLTAGMLAMLGGRIKIAAPATVQKGQVCKLYGSDVRSAQKWNCAVRNTIPRSSADRRMRDKLPGM